MRAIALVLLLAGCGGSRMSTQQIHTGGQTGCRPEEVEMGEINSNYNAGLAVLDSRTASQTAMWWEAKCRGVLYNCTGQQDQYAVRDVVCRPAQPPAPPQQQWVCPEGWRYDNGQCVQ